jgi:hypothetical protein
MKLKNNIPFGLIGFLVSAMFLIYGPLRQMTESGGPILLFGSDILINVTIITFLGGSVCGLLLSKKSKSLGSLIGGLSSCAGGALYTFYFLSGGSPFILGSIGVLFALLVTVGPGAYIYHVATREKE